jgi:peptidoglycan/LPS O-acetylase OafA/YrhL
VDKSSADHFRGFDGIRAIAILLVVLWHGAYVTEFSVQVLGPLKAVVTMGWAGVDLFFALSGFLITSLLLREERRALARTGSTTFSLERFYVRRALRILPVFYVVFLLNPVVFSGYLQSVDGRRVLESASPLGLWPYATFWGNYFATFHGSFGPGVVFPGNSYAVLWSLCVEEHFYLLWPFFLALVKTPRNRVVVALAVCVLMAAGRFVSQKVGAVQAGNIPQLSHLRMDSILWGSVGALLIDRMPSRPAIRRLVLVLLGGFVWVLIARDELTALSRPSPFGISVGLTLLALIATGLLVELMQAPRSWLVRVLARARAGLGADRLDGQAVVRDVPDSLSSHRSRAPAGVRPTKGADAGQLRLRPVGVRFALRGARHRSAHPGRAALPEA